MVSYTTWQDAITGSLQGLWIRFANFIPQVIVALIVLIFGLIIASVLGGLVTKLISLLGIDRFMERYGVTKRLGEMGINFTLAELLGWIVKWFIIIAVWVAVLQVLHLDQIGQLLQRLILFLPNVITAVV